MISELRPVSYLVSEDLIDAWNGYSKDCAETYSPVLSKREFTRRYKLGEFGNRAPTWDTLEQFLESDYRGGLLHLRNRVAGGDTYYNLTSDELIDKWLTVPSQSQFYCSSMAPHHLGLIQGEVQQGVKGLELFYAPALLPMREALKKEGRQTYGLEAVLLLKANLCPNSWEWLNVLLDRYQFHVVEFTSFSCEWGTIPGYKMIVWEVRRY